MAHGHASVTAKPWTPWLLSPKLWLDASDASTITESSGAVSEWRDKSGNGYAFTQSTSTAQPTTGSATQNSRNVLSFDGGDSLVSTAAASTWKFLQDGTAYLVGFVSKRNTAGVNGAVFGTYGGGSTDGAAFRYLSTNRMSHYISTTGTVTQVVDNYATLGTSTATRLTTVYAEPSLSTWQNRSYIWVDGGTAQNNNIYSTAVSTANPAYTLAIGNRLNSAMPLTGTIAEIVVVTGAAVTTTNRTLLHDYLNKKWALY